MKEVTRRPTPRTGADPELFVINKSGNVVPGSKILDADGSSDAQLIYDNAAVELRPSAKSCLEYTMRSLKIQIKRLHRAIDRSRYGHTVSLRPAFDISRYKLDTSKGCNIFGCDPTMIFTADGELIAENEPNVDPEETTLRSVGYHVHVGNGANWGSSYANATAKRSFEALHDIDTQVVMTGLNDLYLGLFGVLMEQDWADQVRMRRDEIGYGVAGEFRQQPHGYEYRTLGPWPIRSPIWSWWAGSTARDVFDLVRAGAHKYILPKMDRPEVCRAINTCDYDLALKLWNEARTHLLDYYDEYGQSLSRGSCALHPKNIIHMEWAVASGRGRKAFLDDTVKYNPGKEQVENMWNAWETYQDHKNMNLPDTARRCMMEQDDHASFFDEWDRDRDNISEWEG